MKQTKRNKPSSGRRTRRQALPAKYPAKRRSLHKIVLHPITVFMLLCVGVVLVSETWHSLAVTDEIHVHAKVPAPPLTEPAVITSPADGTVFRAVPITVSGTCPADSYVTLTRNNLFSGVALCDTTALTFSITTDLFAGANVLVVQDYNITDDAGPGSPGIIVTYIPPLPVQPAGGNGGTPQPGSNPGVSASNGPLVMAATFRYQAFQAGQAFQWTIGISGGSPPYRIRTTWGDGSMLNEPVASPRTFTLSHTYDAPGRYVIQIEAGDARGNKTVLQLMAIINGAALPKAAASGGSGATGLTSELIFHPGNAEFLTVGSTLHRSNGFEHAAFTTSADAQELFCQWDAGYRPLSFVFGNVAYSIGFGRGITGAFRQLAKGEVRQYSDIFNTTRHLALQRIEHEAKAKGANSVAGIRTSILPVGLSGIQEMVMIGTASYHDKIAPLAGQTGGVTTSDLTAEETWNVAKMGYAPLRLVIGTSVYSLGLAGGIVASFRNLVRGEVREMTHMIYGAREESLKKLQDQAKAVGADDVLGIKTYIYNLGNGVIEFLAIGTAVKRIPKIETYSEQLPPQAIIRDKDTFVNTAEPSFGSDLQNPRR